MDKERLSALPYYFQNWLVLNKTPFYQWETHFFRKNMLLVCLEIYEELEQKLRTEHTAIKMDLKEVWMTGIFYARHRCPQQCVPCFIP